MAYCTYINGLIRPPCLLPNDAILQARGAQPSFFTFNYDTYLYHFIVDRIMVHAKNRCRMYRTCTYVHTAGTVLYDMCPPDPDAHSIPLAVAGSAW